MKKILLPLLLMVGAIWGSCVKDHNVIAPLTKSTNESVSDRGPCSLTVTITGALDFDLCGNFEKPPLGQGCTNCSGPELGRYVIDTSPATVTMLGKPFVLRNTTGSTQTVTFFVSGASSGTSYSVPAGNNDFHIDGCSVVTGCQ